MALYKVFATSETCSCIFLGYKSTPMTRLRTPSVSLSCHSTSSFSLHWIPGVVLRLHMTHASSPPYPKHIDHSSPSEFLPAGGLHTTGREGRDFHAQT